MNVAELMKTLDCSEAEAKDIIQKDKEIDKGADPFPLNKSQAEVSKKMRSVGRAPTAYKFTKRERKSDNAKRDLIDVLTQAVQVYGASSVDVVSAEREFTFKIDDRLYKIVLSCPRK